MPTFICGIVYSIYSLSYYGYNPSNFILSVPKPNLSSRAKARMTEKSLPDKIGIHLIFSATGSGNRHYFSFHFKG